MKNRIYISLPISGRDMEDVESAIKSAAAQIEKHGFKAVSPLEVSPRPRIKLCRTHRARHHRIA